MNINYFWGNGINVVAKGDGGPEGGNADSSYFENCNAGLCGCDGFHFDGGTTGDAQACVISRCSGVVNRRAGFYDATFGNTYLGCHTEENTNQVPGNPNREKNARDYITEADANASVFITCWSEGGDLPNQFHGAVTIISGKIGENPKYMTDDSSAFILEHGVATRAPLVYKNLNRKAVRAIGVSLGDMGTTVQGPGTEMIAFHWATLTSADDQNIVDSTWLHYLDAPGVRGRQWWALSNNDRTYRPVIRFPTIQTNARQAAPWFVNGIVLGRDDNSLPEDPPKVSFTEAPAPPDLQYNGTPLTYERGDVVWNSAPSPSGPIGQVCITSGTQSTLNGGATTGSITNGTTELTVSASTGLAIGQHITISGVFGVKKIVGLAGLTVTIDAAADATVANAVVAIVTTGSITNGTTELTVSASTGLAIGQYITIAGVSGVKKIVGLAGLTVTIDTAADATVADAPVAFSPATFSTFGEVDSPSASYDDNKLLTLKDRYVTVTKDGKIMTLPASPRDGQTHSIKSKAGVTTTVDTEGGALTIDGQPSVPLAPGNNGTFRYSAAIGAKGEWELR